MARNHKVDADAVLARVQIEGPDGRVSQGEAAALLDLLLAGPSSYERRKLLRNQLVIAGQPSSRRSRLPKVEYASTGIKVNDLAHWAAELYGQKLTSLPQRPRVRRMTLTMNDVACVFRPMPATDSDGSRPLIPSMPATLPTMSARVPDDAGHPVEGRDAG